MRRTSIRNNAAHVVKVNNNTAHVVGVNNTARVVRVNNNTARVVLPLMFVDAVDSCDKCE